MQGTLVDKEMIEVPRLYRTQKQTRCSLGYSIYQLIIL